MKPTDHQLALREAACCLWETVNHHRVTGNKHADPAIIATLENHGTSAIRFFCCEVADQLDAAWQAVTPELFDGPFDWEFCPRFAVECIDWDPDGIEMPVIRENYMAIVKERAVAWQEGTVPDVAATA